jgi:hypothetical protein
MRNLLIAIILIGVLGCKKSKTISESPAPAKANLLAPAASSTCNTGTIVSSTEAKIALVWTAALNTNSYEVKIKNLITGSTFTKTTTDSQIEINLSRNAPYSWSVVSKSDNTSVSAETEVWKFYVAGEATFSYAPFPAEILSPGADQTIPANAGMVNLDWSGSDVDNDVIGYDVYLGTSVSSMTAVKSNLTESQASGIQVNSGTTYFWKIITRDSKGNSSDSGLYKFTVN